jgi:glycosidase
VKEQEARGDSLLAFYRRLTALRQRVNETWSVKVIFQINADQRKTSL